MIWWPSFPICPLLAAGCIGADERVDTFPNVGVYEASPAQARVDRSISDIAITTPLERVRSRMTELRSKDCEDHGECEWRDAAGARYPFWADEPFAYFVVDKRVQGALVDVHLSGYPYT